MTKKMLIDASHPEETRVVVVDGTRVEELDFESENKRQLRGNVYLARVTRVEPSLQAAFVEYGGNRHGFLAFSEIHPDYYQIPIEDREALLEDEVKDNLADEKAVEKAIESKADAKIEDTSDTDTDVDIEAVLNEASDEDETSADDAPTDVNSDNANDAIDLDAADKTEQEDEEEQEKMLGARRKRLAKRRYKIQEVIKRGQILLIQAVKEERGNKGAAMTTYLSLAGRYCVLMPNTPRGGGISRKIGTGGDRKRLKSIMSELSVPQGMGVIVRTAGAKRTKAEIKRDFEYLSRLWDTIRSKTLESIAPALIHEEGNLVKRSIRDLYGKDIDSVLVQGDEAYRLAKDFIKMLMPSHAKNVKAYKDDIPLFLRYQVETQIEACLDPVVQLKSGGYLVIHPTEALVSVDVNSGRSTKERNVERTALKTNLEAAEEVARQMRLRDLAGLVVIDFIDMDENRNNRAVEKKMREALERDRARVQMGKISQFGLMEISRQRRRRSLLEGSTAPCEHCQGVGRKRSVESSALKAIRAVEEEGVRGKSKRMRLKVTADVAFYLFNEKRELLSKIDEASNVFTEIVVDPDLIRPDFKIERLEASGESKDPLENIHQENRKAEQAERKESRKAEQSERNKNRKSKKPENAKDSDDESEEADNNADRNDEERPQSKSKRRRGRRGGRNRRNNNGENRQDKDTQNAAEEKKDTPVDETPSDKSDTDGEKVDAKPKRTRRKKTVSADKEAAAEDTAKDNSEAVKPDTDDKAEKPARKRRVSKKQTESDAAEKPAPKKRASRAKAKPESKTGEDAASETKAKPAAKKAPAKKATAKKAAPKKAAPKKAETKANTVDSADKAKPEPKAKPAASAASNSVAKTETEAKTAKNEESGDAKPKKTGWWQKRNPFA